MESEWSRVAADRTAPAGERGAAIGELAAGVGADLAARASLWHDLLLDLLFDESEDTR